MYQSFKSLFIVLFCSSGSSNVDQEWSVVFLYPFPHFLHLLSELLIEVHPQVCQLVNLRLVRVAIMLQLEEPFEKQEIRLLLLQSLSHPFHFCLSYPSATTALAVKDIQGKEVDQVKGWREC